MSLRLRTDICPITSVLSLQLLRSLLVSYVFLLSIMMRSAVAAVRARDSSNQLA